MKVWEFVLIWTVIIYTARHLPPKLGLPLFGVSLLLWPFVW